MRDTTATYQQFQLLVEQHGCPVCALSEQAVHVYLDTLLWESSTDLNLHAMLVASLGFCGRHSRQLLTFGGQRLAAAVVERASLLAATWRLPELAIPAEAPPSPRSRLGRLWPWAKAPAVRPTLPADIQPCPACVRQFAEEERGVEVLLAHLDEFAGPLLRAGGLCLPHFIHATHAAGVDARATLLAVQQKAWAELAANMEEFIRKHNEHHHSDPIGDPARLAVEHTIASLTSASGVR